MTLFQRVVGVLTAVAVILQLLDAGERPDLPVTMLRVFAILIAGGTIFWLNPGRKVLLSAAVVLGLGGAALGSLALWDTLRPQTPSPSARWELVPAPQTSTVESPTPSSNVSPGGTTVPPRLSYAPAVPTLSELADAPVVRSASITLDVYVDIGHQSFQQLHATDKDKLCKAGKAIRDSMKAHHNTLADLNYTERAIFDITAPAGRCH